MNNIMVNSGVWIPESPVLANQAHTLFHIGSLPVHTYSLTMMFGMIASILTCLIFWKRARYDINILLMLIFLTIPSAIFGARLWLLVENAIYSPNYDWSSWYKIWEGGLSIQGGVALAVIVDLIYAYTKRDKIDIRKACDIIIPTILIGQVIGRWGNYANHEVYGRIDWNGTGSLIFGKNFASNMFIKDSIGTGYRYPLFLYEGIANLIGYMILVWIINLFGLLKPGANAPLYFVWYGVVRMSMEPLRQEKYSIYLVAAILFLIGGFLGFIFFQFLNPVHYLREWRKYRFIYQYAHPEQYIAWIEKTRFKTKKSKPITKVIT
ncbi:prolipoprotein diacylglyceryl transferase [Mycoplasma tauri]|uniref:prolipoprotein diacylglyceryl transferase n=1 Tax=Mycoplasma tauri TaxID=547987 RepID=UPI001CC1B973|nr:prolipoprotein diacylglyceryl transferase [Mycoplasma tauri]MBZ4204313.1 prolipoprotein diacylglyceryl transferase [Mycoplasma tauri]